MLNKLLEHYGLEEDSVDILKNNNKICEICDKRCGITYSAKNVNDKIEYNDNYPCNEDVTYFERQGIKFNDYIELLTNFHDEQFQSEDDYEFELYEFSIDGIKVVIDHPSELFEEFVDFSHDDMYANEWFYTISLRGITDDNYNEYLEKVLFVLKYYNDSVVWPFDFKCDKYYSELDDKDTWFNKIKLLCDELGYASDMKAYKENPDSFKGNVADVSTVIRVALTTSSMTPDLYELLKLIGKERIEKRFSKFY